MSKLSLVMQAIIILLLAIIIALVVYYGTNPPKSIRAPIFPQTSVSTFHRA